MQFKNIENYDLVKEALIEANRRDLIGFGPECLIPPDQLVEILSVLANLVNLVMANEVANLGIDARLEKGVVEM